MEEIINFHQSLDLQNDRMRNTERHFTITITPFIKNEAHFYSGLLRQLKGLDHLEVLEITIEKNSIFQLHQASLLRDTLTQLKLLQEFRIKVEDQCLLSNEGFLMIQNSFLNNDSLKVLSLSIGVSNMIRINSVKNLLDKLNMFFALKSFELKIDEPLIDDTQEGIELWKGLSQLPLLESLSLSFNLLYIHNSDIQQLFAILSLLSSSSLTNLKLSFENTLSQKLFFQNLSSCIQSLSQLKSLTLNVIDSIKNIEEISDLPLSFGALKELEYLNISDNLKTLLFSSPLFLQTLKNLNNLKELKLSIDLEEQNRNRCEQLEIVDCLQNMRNLSILGINVQDINDILYDETIEVMSKHISEMKSLKKLKLCLQLELNSIKLTHLLNSIQQLNQLHVLKITLEISNSYSDLMNSFFSSLSSFKCLSNLSLNIKIENITQNQTYKFEFLKHIQLTKFKLLFPQSDLYADEVISLGEGFLSQKNLEKLVIDAKHDLYFNQSQTQLFNQGIGSLKSLKRLEIRQKLVQPQQNLSEENEEDEEQEEEKEEEEEYLQIDQEIGEENNQENIGEGDQAVEGEEEKDNEEEITDGDDYLTLAQQKILLDELSKKLKKLNQTIQKTRRIQYEEICNLPNLQEMNITACGFICKQSFAESLLKNSKLQKLKIVIEDRITLEEFLTFLPTLKCFTCIRTLHLSFQIETSTIMDFGDVFEDFFNAVRCIEDLTFIIYLSYQKSNFFQSFSRGLSHLFSLNCLKLTIDSTFVDTDDLDQLGQCLSRLKNLRYLDLSIYLPSEVSSYRVLNFVNQLRNLNNLTEVNFDFNMDAFILQELQNLTISIPLINPMIKRFNSVIFLGLNGIQEELEQKENNSLPFYLLENVDIECQIMDIDSRFHIRDMSKRQEFTGSDLFTNVKHYKYLNKYSYDQQYYHSQQLLKQSIQITSLFEAFIHNTYLQEFKFQVEKSILFFGSRDIESLQSLTNLDKFFAKFSQCTLIEDQIFFASLVKLLNLKYLCLNFNDTPVSNEAIEVLGNGLIGMNKLNSINITFDSDCQQIGQGESALGRNLSFLINLQSFNLKYKNAIQNMSNEFGITQLSLSIQNLKKLQDLVIYFDQYVSHKDIQLLAESLSQLEYLRTINLHFGGDVLIPQRVLSQLIQSINMLETLYSVQISLKKIERSLESLSEFNDLLDIREITRINLNISNKETCYLSQMVLSSNYPKQFSFKLELEFLARGDTIRQDIFLFGIFEYLDESINAEIQFDFSQRYILNPSLIVNEVLKRIQNIKCLNIKIIGYELSDLAYLFKIRAERLSIDLESNSVKTHNRLYTCLKQLTNLRVVSFKKICSSQQKKLLKSLRLVDVYYSSSF